MCSWFQYFGSNSEVNDGLILTIEQHWIVPLLDIQSQPAKTSDREKQFEYLVTSGKSTICYLKNYI